MKLSPSLALLGGSTLAQAVYQGFNYGSTFSDGSIKQQQDFENEFNRAKTLQGTSGFTAGRLYTMIQGNTVNTVSAAIPAAVNTKTELLLGLWASAGQADFNNEVDALTSAISQYGTAFTSLIAGISVGSEDLYRVSPTGIENHSGAGATPDQLVSYINQVRAAIKGTSASSALVGHVDTWTAWVNGSNAAVVQAVDFLGTDGYPYFQTTEANGINVASSLYFDSYNATVGVATGKPVWITETGYPVSGQTANDAVPSIANAETYWQEVACRVLGNINTFWYTLQDAYPVTPSPSFGIVGYDLNSAPLYNLTCSNGNTPSSSSTSPSTPSTSSTTVKVQSSTTEPHSTASSSIITTPSVETSPSSISQPTSSQAPPKQSSSPASTAPISTPTTSPSTSSCPTNLNGAYQFPHLIVSINADEPNTAYGTSYDGKITPSISSIFNFDIPSSYAGKTCSLVFLFPNQAALETSSYTFNSQGGIKVAELSSPATESTSYANAPASGGLQTSINSVTPGNSYSVFSHECSAGQRVGFEFSSTGGLDLTYFQDYNPSPIGAYITVC